MISHIEAATQCADGFRQEFRRDPNRAERQCLQAVGLLETSYGAGWKGAGAGSYNMGAIIAGSSWKGETFSYRDSRPFDAAKDKPVDADASGNVWYTTKFRKYPTPAAGWADLAAIVYGDRPAVLAAATAGDVYGVSVALYETRYYLGRGATIKARIDGHASAMTRCLTSICRACGEPLPSGKPLPPPTLKRGDVGEHVKELQRLLGLVADGHFGPLTDRALKDYQDANGLIADGVAGPATWAALEAEDADSDRVTVVATPAADHRYAVLSALETAAATIEQHWKP